MRFLLILFLTVFSSCSKRDIEINRLERLSQNLVDGVQLEESRAGIEALLKSSDPFTRARVLIEIQHLNRNFVDTARYRNLIIASLYDSDGAPRREAMLALLQFETVSQTEGEHVIRLISRHPNTCAAWFAIDGFSEDGLLRDYRGHLFELLEGRSVSFGRESMARLHKIGWKGREPSVE